MKKRILIFKELLRLLIKLNRIRKSSEVIQGIDRFHSVSEHVKGMYVKAGFSENKIKVVPSILDEKFVVNHVSEFEEPFKLLYVGYLKEHKGADRLIPIIQDLEDLTDKKFTLTIVGEGPLYSKIEEQVKSASVEERMEMKGFVPNSELPEVYASHDVLVNPVKWEEPWGRVFLESLSAGTPILSTDVENAKALNGVETTKDIGSFAEKLVEMLDKRKLQELSKQGKDEMNKYMPEKTVENIEKSMEEILTKEV